MTSRRFRMGKTKPDVRARLTCREWHGKIHTSGERAFPVPPLHGACRCEIVALRALLGGTATRNGADGADLWLKWHGILPGYYIGRREAKAAGWVGGVGNLDRVAPGKMLFGGVYENRNGHLPSAPGRIWLEADIHYTRGVRGMERILFSSDG